MIAVASHISLLGFAGLMLAAAISDIRSLLIPNWIPPALALPLIATTADLAKQPLPYGVAIALGATYLALRLFGVV